VPSPAPTHSTSDPALLADLESHASEEPEDSEWDSDDEDSVLVEVENDLSTAATTNTRIARRFPRNTRRRSRDDGDNSTTNSGAGTGTGSFRVKCYLAIPHLSILHAARERKRIHRGVFLSTIAEPLPDGGSIGGGRSTSPIISSRPMSSSMPSPHVKDPCSANHGFFRLTFCDM
jgi:hypothetical protein